MTNTIDPTATFYKYVKINDSSLGKNSIVGDFSRLKKCIIGNYCSIDRQNFILHSIIKDYSYTGPWNMIFESSIGKYCSISYGVTIGPPEHNYKLLSTHPFIYRSKYELFEDNDIIEQQRFEKKIIIGNDVWIGCNSVIARGVNIGDGAVVGANSFVDKDVPSYAIVAGSPAKIIKYRFEEEIIEILKEIKWWNLAPEKIKRCKKFFLDEISIESIKEFQQELAR